MQHADDVIERAAIDGQPAVGLVATSAKHLVEGRRDVDGGEPRARHHQLAARCAARAAARDAAGPAPSGSSSPPSRLSAMRSSISSGRVHVAMARWTHAAAAAAAARRCRSGTRSTRRTAAATTASAARSPARCGSDPGARAISAPARRGSSRARSATSSTIAGRRRLRRISVACPPARSSSGASRGAMRGLPVGAENQAGERDADLRCGDVAIELVRDLRRPAGCGRPSALPSSARRRSRLRRAPTAANSAATYSAVSRIRKSDDRRRGKHAGGWLH